MKNRIAIGLVFTGLVMSTSAFAAYHATRSSWEAFVVADGLLPADVEELQIPTGFAAFPAGTDLTLPSGKTLAFDKDLQGAEVPTDWATWSGGQTPRVLALLDGSHQVTGTFSAPVECFGLEMEPNVFSDFIMQLVLSDGTSFVQTVNGFGGALFFGWTEQPVISFAIKSGDDFAFGRMVECTEKPVTSVPEGATTLLLLGIGLVAIGGVRRSLNQ